MSRNTLELQSQQVAQCHGFEAPPMLCRNVKCITLLGFCSICGSPRLDLWCCDFVIECIGSHPIYRAWRAVGWRKLCCAVLCCFVGNEVSDICAIPGRYYVYCLI